MAEILSRGIDLINKIIIKNDDADLRNDKLLMDDINSFIDSITKGKLTEAKKTDITKNKPKEMPVKKIKKIKKEIPNINLKADTFKIFLAEAEERINNAQDIILKLENDLFNKSFINELFRIFHTIKGECGFLKINSMGEFTHSLENLLDIIRNNEIENNTNIIDILLNGIDIISDMLETLKKEDIRAFSEIETDDFINNLNEMLANIHVPIGEILKDKGQIKSKEINKIIEKQKESGFDKKFGEIAIEENLITEKDLQDSLKTQKETIERTTIKADPVIKVKASQINYLVDMIGELIIAQNQLEDKNIIQLKKITKSEKIL
jgi:two-component system chemotaxis sensor kinase CheA